MGIIDIDSSASYATQFCLMLLLTLEFRITLPPPAIEYIRSAALLPLDMHVSVIMRHSAAPS